MALYGEPMSTLSTGSKTNGLGSFTVSLWYYPIENPALGTDRAPFSILADGSWSGNGTCHFYWSHSTQSGMHNALVFAPNGTTWYTASFGAAPALNTWHHFLFLYNGGSWVTYLNGAYKTGNSQTKLSSTTYTTRIGSITAKGGVAEVGMWTAALAIADIIALSKGMAPSAVRPNALSEYVPLIRSTVNMKGTISGGSTATWSPHPRIYK